jgi:integrase
MAKGIEERHARSCRSRKGGRCDCEPSYRADVWDGGQKRRLRHTFTDRAEAASWRRDAAIAIRRGRKVNAGQTDSLRDVATVWLAAARKGNVRTRSGDPYKPSAVRGYEQNLRRRVFDDFGDEPMADIRRPDLQELVDRWVGHGLAPATVRATIIPLKAIFRRELELDRVKVNPTIGLRLPAVRSRRERIAPPAEAAALIAALPEADRGVWATAMYAGLRRGELRALRVDRIDLDANLIHVHHGWDDKEGEIATKGRNRRRVPIPKALREHLVAQLVRSGRRGGDLVFGDTPAGPFAPKRLTERADGAWEACKLERLTLHDCRHTYASYMIAAGVNAKALSEYMGHASIAITMDRYGHLMPGNEHEAAVLLDTYLGGAGQ